MAGTTSTKLLVACSAAVGAVYAGAYFYTEPAAQATTTAAQAVSGHVSTTSSANASSRQSPTPSTTAANKSQPTYKDGTYTGSGSNAYGTLSAEISIVGGKIAAVKITSYTMHYPESYVDPQMNREFIQMQTYRVYAVSGATASSYNFAEAVYYALQKAKA